MIIRPRFSCVVRKRDVIISPKTEKLEYFKWKWRSRIKSLVRGVFCLHGFFTHNVLLPQKTAWIVFSKCTRNKVISGLQLVQCKTFKKVLDKSLKCNNTVNFSDFQNTLLQSSTKMFPLRNKILRFNNSPFISKALRKAIMHRSKFKNIYNKKRDM